MKLFINDIPVEILRLQDMPDQENFDIVIRSKGDAIVAGQLQDDVLLINATTTEIERVFMLLKQNKLKALDSIVFAVDDHESVVHFIKKKFTVIKAAGGLVVKDGKFLMIYRLGKWDLPKGKLEKKEKSKEGAIREVEEECSVKVKLGEKICATWHTYTRNGKRILKKCSWYEMTCLDESDMAPQKEESIEDVRWMDAREARAALYNSYPSIREVFKVYHQHQKQKI